MVDKKKNKKDVEYNQKLGEITQDLQRTRADFENYVKRSETEKISARQAGQSSAILKLLPVIDNIERAITCIPKELKDNAWAQGIAQMVKQLDNQLEAIGVTKIDQVGIEFDPQKHEAVIMEETEGDTEVIAEILQTGYLFDNTVIRPAKVKVKRVK